MLDIDQFEARNGDVTGLFGLLPPNARKMVRKIADAPNYDYAAMELLDALDIEWRVFEKSAI